MALAFLDEEPQAVSPPERAQVRSHLELLIAHGSLVEAVGGAENEDAAMGALFQLLIVLQAEEAMDNKGRLFSQFIAGLKGDRTAPQQNAGAPALPADWMWGQPNEDPGTKNFGPALTEAQIAEWESRHGVALPGIVRQAYQQQNGGMIRSQRLFLFRLEEVEPLGEAYVEEFGAGLPQPYDPALTFDFGYDDEQGGEVLLAYRSPDDTEPAFYAYWSDGESVAWTSTPNEILREGLPG